MKRITAVIASNTMNNWDVLSQGIILGDDEYQVVFHRDPRMSINESGVHFNFDIVVNDGNLTIDDIAISELVPAQAIHTIRRYNKVEQQLRLLNYVTSHKQYLADRSGSFKNFYPVITHHHHQSMGLTHLINPSNPVVIKPLDGARGIGQFLIDPKKVPLIAVIDILDRYRVGRLNAEDVLPALKKYDPELRYATAGENREGEGLSVILSQGYCIQSYIPTIAEEYRLITGSGGAIAYCQKRTVRKASNSDFAQATGSDANSCVGSDVCDIESVLAKKDLKELGELTRDVIGPLSSIDLFLTEDGKWGIFEYCNQFGIKGVPFETTRKMHADLLYGLIKRAGL